MSMVQAGISAQRSAARRYASFYVPLLLLLAFSVLVRRFDLDMRVSALFYRQGEWFLGDHALVQLLYRYGTWPTFATGIACLIVWIGARWRPAWQTRRTLAKFIALCMIIGPGLLVNNAIKETAGRPRPRAVVEFGGDRQFVPVGDINWFGDDRSFPSGHASMGFFWLSLAIYFWHRRRSLAWGFIALGVTHGALMSLTRISQGGHFLSDTLWAGSIVYLTAWLIYHLGGFETPQERGV